MRKVEIHLYAQRTGEVLELISKLEEKNNQVLFKDCPDREQPLVVSENGERFYGMEDIKRSFFGEI